MANVGRLVRKTDQSEVEIGDVIASETDGEKYIVKGFRKPHKSNSTGRVFVVSETSPHGFEQSFFPQVFGLEIVNSD